MSAADDDSLAAIREGVRQLCARFPGPYWRDLDERRAYPAEFVRALTEAGYLACLIPEAYGGSGLGLTAAAAILETIHESGCNGAACHAQMYTMGTLLRHGSEEQKTRWLPDIAAGRLRLQAFGVTEPTAGSDTTAIATTAVRDGDRYLVTGQKSGPAARSTPTSCCSSPAPRRASRRGSAPRAYPPSSSTCARPRG